LDYIKKIYQTPLFRVTSLNSVSVVVRILGGLLASKMLALFVGPSGMALVGNFRNFLASLDYFSVLGLQNGIIKYTAEHEKDSEKLYHVLATVFYLVLATVVVLSIILFTLAELWGEWIFGTREYSWIFRLLAFSMPWYAGNLLFMAILNGLGRYRQVIGVNIWSNIVGVLLSAVLIWQFGVTGAFFGLLLNPALIFIMSFYWVYKGFPRFPFLRKKYYDSSLLHRLFSFSLMSLVTALLAPIVYISVRNTIIEQIGADEAGYWESVNRIATYYLMFISTLLTVHFLPRLSTATDLSATKKVFRSYYTGIVPIFALGLIVIYLLRVFMIKMLLSEDFVPMEKLFFWQMVGDFFKVCSLILGYEVIAKKKTTVFIVTETLSFTILYFTSHFFIGEYGIEGAVMAHAFTYFIYTCMLATYSWKKL